MNRIILLIVYFSLIVNLFAQENEAFEPNKLFDVSLNLNYVTGAKVFLYPRASDPDIRNLYYSFEGFLSYSFEIKANVYNGYLYVGISTEYLKAAENIYSVRALVNNLPRTLQVEESFNIYPVELMSYYIFPFSRDWYSAYMGAGFGVYYGKYKRKIFDLVSESSLSRFDYGILVNAGVDIFLIDNLYLKFEMKFRDPELEFKNEFAKTQTVVNGNNIQLFEKYFDTKINLDGLNFILGLNYRF